eukprot:COSAG01_NODE_398_length_17547_cov_206.793501_19_plen_171_part_00
MKKIIKLSIFAVIMAGVMLNTACEQKLEHVGQSRIIEQSKKRVPKWVKRSPKKDKKNYYFVGDMVSPTPTNRFAYKMALTKVSHFINARASSTFTSREKFKNNAKSPQQIVDNYIKVVSNASIKGAEEKDAFWQKIETLTEKGVDTHYQVYVLVSVPKDIILSAEQNLID